MSNFVISDEMQQIVKGSMDSLNQIIIGVTNYIDKSESQIGDFYKNNSSKLKRKSDILAELSRDYFKAAQDILNNSNSPQAKRVAQDIASVNERIAKSSQSESAYLKALSNIEKATEAFHSTNAKAAGLAGAAVTATDVAMKANAGDWEGVGQSLSGLLGSIAFAELAAKFAIFGIGLFGASLSAPAVIAIVAASAALGAIFGDLAGKKAWDNTKDYRESLSDWLSDSFSAWLGLDRQGNYYIYDPLILDLDGDGIETVGIDFKTASNNAYFDFDNDGRLNATGWVKSDDGLLVRDLNNDGLINNGSEIFGDRTLKQNGELATHGFDALADLDDNKDGIINHQDSAFNTLKVWQDYNKDGISQADELKSLSDLNIQSFRLLRM